MALDQAAESHTACRLMWDEACLHTTRCTLPSLQARAKKCHVGRLAGHQAPAQCPLDPPPPLLPGTGGPGGSQTPGCPRPSGAGRAEGRGLSARCRGSRGRRRKFAGRHHSVAHRQALVPIVRPTARSQWKRTCPLPRLHAALALMSPPCLCPRRFVKLFPAAFANRIAPVQPQRPHLVNVLEDVLEGRVLVQDVVPGWAQSSVCACVRVHACARARVHVCVCVCASVDMCVTGMGGQVTNGRRSESRTAPDVLAKGALERGVQHLLLRQGVHLWEAAKVAQGQPIRQTGARSLITPSTGVHSRPGRPRWLAGPTFNKGKQCPSLFPPQPPLTLRSWTMRWRRCSLWPWLRPDPLSWS